MKKNIDTDITKIMYEQIDVKNTYAKACISPSMTASRIILNTFSNIDLDLGAIQNQLDQQLMLLENGDTRQIENMLLCQSHALQALFEKASFNAVNSPTVELLRAWADIAFKAEKQSRQALGNLLHFKNPKHVAFIKQQNNAHFQQVNNQEAPKDFENFLKTENIPNELLSEVKTYETLDLSRKTEAIIEDKKMEAVGTLDRTKVTKR